MSDVKVNSHDTDVHTLVMDNLEICFHTAKAMGERYVGILISMEGFEKPEVIINESANFDSKLEYYKSAYDEKLNHKHAKGIYIAGFTFGNSFAEIEYDLLGTEND